MRQLGSVPASSIEGPAEFPLGDCFTSSDSTWAEHACSAASSSCFVACDAAVSSSFASSPR